MAVLRLVKGRFAARSADFAASPLTSPAGRAEWALAEQIRVRAHGTYVFKPTTQYRSLREAVRAYGVATKEQTRAKNRFRSLLGLKTVPGLGDVRAAQI